MAPTAGRAHGKPNNSGARHDAPRDRWRRATAAPDAVLDLPRATRTRATYFELFEKERKGSSSLDHADVRAHTPRRGNRMQERKGDLSHLAHHALEQLDLRTEDKKQRNRCRRMWIRVRDVEPQRRVSAARAVPRGRASRGTRGA